MLFRSPKSRGATGLATSDFDGGLNFGDATDDYNEADDSASGVQRMTATWGCRLRRPTRGVGAPPFPPPRWTERDPRGASASQGRRLRRSGRASHGRRLRRDLAGGF